MLNTIVSLISFIVKGESEVEIDPWNWEAHFCPDCPVAEMCWYRGFYPDAPNLAGWFWCERGVNPRWLPNFISYDADYEPYDTRQGVTYANAYPW
jgi:hypothetical protein